MGIIFDEKENSGFFADRVTALKFEREMRGMTIAELARVSWTNTSDLSKIERGRAIPYRKQAQRIAAALNWDRPLEELFAPIDTGK